MENQGGDYNSNGFSNSPNNLNSVFNNEGMGRSDITSLNHQQNPTRLVPDTQMWSMPVQDQLVTMPSRENPIMSSNTAGSMNVVYPSTGCTRLWSNSLNCKHSSNRTSAS